MPHPPQALRELPTGFHSTAFKDRVGTFVEFDFGECRGGQAWEWSRSVATGGKQRQKPTKTQQTWGHAGEECSMGTFGQQRPSVGELFCTSHFSSVNATEGDTDRAATAKGRAWLFFFNAVYLLTVPPSSLSPSVLINPSTNHVSPVLSTRPSEFRSTREVALEANTPATSQTRRANNGPKRQWHLRKCSIHRSLVMEDFLSSLLFCCNDKMPQTSSLSWRSKRLKGFLLLIKVIWDSSETPHWSQNNTE